MTADTITIPISAIIFLGSTIVTCLGGLFTTCAHLLIAIRTSLAQLVTDMGVRNAQTDARLCTIERHDQNNEEDKRWAARNALFDNQNQKGSPNDRT